MRTLSLFLALLVSLVLVSGCLTSNDDTDSGDTDKPDNNGNDNPVAATGIISPAANTSFWLGQKMTVAWKSGDLTENDMVDVILYRSDTSITVGSNVPACTSGDSGSYTFFIYDSLIWDWDIFSFEYNLKVDVTTQDTLEFTAGPVYLTYGMQVPSGGETYAVGDTLHVRWVWNWWLCYDWQTLLEFSPDGGITYKVFIPYGIDVEDSTLVGTFDWVIPDSLEGIATRSSNCVIKASPYSGGGEFFNFESGVFTVE